MQADNSEKEKQKHTKHHSGKEERQIFWIKIGEDESWTSAVAASVAYSTAAKGFDSQTTEYSVSDRKIVVRDREGERQNRKGMRMVLLAS